LFFIVEKLPVFTHSIIRSFKIQLLEKAQHTAEPESIQSASEFSKENFESQKPLLIQPKLSVGAIDDPFEREADAMADRVMRMPETSFIQRKCASCEDEERIHRMPETNFLQRKCAACEHEEEEQIHRKITPFIQKQGNGLEGGTATESVTNQINASRGGGSRMSENTLSFMESRFGTDFSGVKIHTDSNAVQMSRELNAQAFTVGSDIYFNSGKYAPDSDSGKYLLAHELTHTVQQGGGVNRKIQRTVDNVEINCGDSQVHFAHDGTTTSYHLNQCNVTDGEYNATVALTPGTVTFTLDGAAQGTNFEFGYDIGPGQSNPNTFFRGQRTVRIRCTHESRASLDGQTTFNVRVLSEADFQRFAGFNASSLPEGVPVGLSNNSSTSIASSSIFGSSFFAPTPMSLVPNNATGVLWTEGHLSIFSNPSNSMSIRGFRGNLLWYMGESLTPRSMGRSFFTQNLLSGVDGSFANDAIFEFLPSSYFRGQQTVLYVQRDGTYASSFAEHLNTTEYNQPYRYSPPRSGTSGIDPVLGEVRPSEAAMFERLYGSTGRPVACTSNCINVPVNELNLAIGMEPATPGGVNVVTGTPPGSATPNPNYQGRASLMTEATREGPLAPGVQRLTMTPAASGGLMVLRVGGVIMLIYGATHTYGRISDTIENNPDQLHLVVGEEAGSWIGGIVGSAVGSAIGAGVVCSPTGPVTLACVAAGFLGGLVVGAGGAIAGSSFGHLVAEEAASAVEAITEPIRQVESEWTRGIYNLYGVPFY
jgi:hypothetical protein